MKVRELIAALEAMPPDADLFHHNPYGSGRCEFTAEPTVETLCLHSGNGSPRYEKDLQYESKANRWKPDRQVVAL